MASRNGKKYGTKHQYPFAFSENQLEINDIRPKKKKETNTILIKSFIY